MKKWMFSIFLSLSLYGSQALKFVEEIDRYYYDTYFEENFQEWYSEVLFENNCFSEVEYKLSEALFLSSQKIVKLIQEWANTKDLIESGVRLGSNPISENDLKKVICFFYEPSYQDTGDYEKIARVNFEYSTKRFFFYQFEYRYPEYCKKDIIKGIEEEYFSKIKRVLKESMDPFLRKEIYPLIKSYASFNKFCADATFSSNRIALLAKNEVEPINLLEEAILDLFEEIDEDVYTQLCEYEDIQNRYVNLFIYGT